MIAPWAWALLAARAGLGGCLAGFGVYTALSAWAAWQWRRARRAPNTDWTPPVTLLKPVCGVDAEAYANFESFCRLDYPAERLQILFGALDPADPALALAESLRAAYPSVDIGLVRGGANAPGGQNQKVRNLAAMLPAARHDLLVLCDSDMRVTPDYLRRVVAPFAPPAAGEAARPVGLVTCPYRGCRPASLAAVLEALGIGADFIPSVLVSRALEGMAFAFGSTIVLPRAVLAALGGFEALADDLADDYRLGRGAKHAGYAVVLSDYVVDDVLGRERFGPMWARRLRWARTIRACRPAGYAGSVVTHGTALALLFLAAMGFSPAGWAVAAGALALRMAVACWIGAACTEDTNILRYLPLLPVSDLVSFALFVASFCGNRITWRGERFRLLPGGKLARL
ncbi:MAG TPA: bacteriohopanetetrol glucosamine biosynthesis glycosyltransferase HpnI [Chthonomonadaceae bacterium]|nr:bacteriohopanetetrol glucosamine biosynthesis glycosyltransferase HpnI [Chthonomonadaceae bacterium]